MSISFSGLASGLDTSSWIESLVSIKQAKVDSLAEEKKILEQTKNVLSSIRSFFDSFRSTLAKVTDSKLFPGGPLDIFAQNLAISSNTAIATAIATSEAKEATYELKVDNLATNTEAISSYMTTITETTIATENSYLKHLGVKAGTIGIKKDGVSQNLTIDDNDTIGSFIKKLQKMGVEASFSNGIFSVNLGVGDITENDTNIIDALGLQDTNTGYETDIEHSKSLSVQTTETVTVTATGTDKLSDFGVLGGTVTIESAGAEYELTIDNEMTINDFVSAIAENTSAIVNFNENTGEFTLQDAKIVSSAITVSESVNAEGTTVKETKTIQEVLGLEEDVFSVSQMTNPLQYATTITTSTAATRDTLLTDIGLETEVAEGANIVVKNKNNEYTTIELDENSTIGSVLDKMTTAGLTATITDDGTIQISNGIIDTDQSTFDVTSAFGLNETPYTGMVTGDSLQITNENAEKINATSLTELTTLGMTAGEVEFDTSSGTKTITITDTMTIASLQEAMRSVGIATTWDNSTAKLTIKNATVGADNANFANTLNLTSNVDSSYTSSNDLYVNVTQSVTTTSATTLGTLSIEIAGEEDLTLHDETGNEIATTVISSETKLEDIIGFVNSYTTTDGVSAGLEGGVLTINGGYISNSTLETGLGMDISSGTSSSIGSVITLTTEGTAGVGNSLKEIISALGTDAETAVAGGYTLTLDGVNVEGIDEDTTITELIGLIEDANTNVSASFNSTTGKITIVGAEVGGTVATALGISATRQTIGVNGTGNKLYVQTQNTATEDTKLSELGITSGTYTVRDSATGDDKATINIEGTQSIKEMLSIMAETTTNKITGTIDNGVITLNSPDGYYIVGTEVENILGIKTEEITTTISSNATSDSAITFTQSVNAERTTKLEDVISNYSEINKTLTIYDAQGNTLATVDTLADTENPIENPTINDLMSVLAANTIQAELTDGVLTLTSGAGYYATGDILTSLGVGTAPDGLVTITTGQTKTSSSALQATTTITAQASTTISDCITMPTEEGDNRNIIIKDSTGNTVTEIAVGTDMTFTQLSAETDDYGITITASNGSLTLNSTSGHYIDDTAMSLALGIQTVDYENGTITNTISSSTTSSEAITFTQSVNAEETTNLQDVISNYSEIDNCLTIYDAQGNILRTDDTLANMADITIGDLISVLAANTIQADLTDGVLTLTSTAGYCATGDILSAFGIDKIPDGEVTVTVGKAVTSTVALAATMTANRDTTIADCITMPTNRTILIKDSEGNVVTNGTIVVTDTMTFTQLSAATDDYGITIDIDANGKLTLQNTGSNYIDETAMSTALGIITNEEATTITVGKATTSSGQITVGSVLTTTTGIEQTGSIALTYDGSTTASLSTTLGSVGLTGSEYTLVVKEYNGDIEKSYTYNSGTSFETIKNDLANHGLTLSMADGVISITPTHSGEIGDNKYVEGTLATALGIGKTTNGTDSVIRYESAEKLTYTIEAVTANGSTTLSDLGVTTKFAQAITRMTQAEAEAAGYTWVTTREELEDAIENGDSIALGCDIDLGDGVWTPYSATEYDGQEINGNGFVIKNMTIDQTVTSNNKGFLASPLSDTIIKNLGFENVNITGDSDDNIGVIVGSSSICEIENCYVEDVTITGGKNVGGIFGTNASEYYADHVNVINLNISGAENAGGIIGASVNDAYEGYITFSGIYSSSINATYAGGFIGDMHGTTVSIDDSVMAGTVNGSTNSGTIAGYGDQGSLIMSKCQYISGDIVGNNDAELDIDTYCSTITTGTYTAPIDNFIEIKDAVSGNTVATITNITAESSINDIFTALSAYGINGYISDTGVINLTSDNTYYATGAILEELGISTTPVAGTTASSSTTLKELNITNAKFNQAITRMTQEEAEAARNTWVTTREALTSALEANTSDIMLGCDIDLSGEVWTPIESFDYGIYGNGFAIKNMTIDDTVTTNKKGFIQNAGDTTFIDLGFENVTIIGDSDDSIGVFAGASEYLYVDNCYVDNVNITGGNTVGGIVGDAGAETELSFVNINNLTISSAAYAGGLLGVIEQGEINIENSSISGNISATYDAGGVIACADGQYDTNVYISDSKIFTTVSGADAGQIIGYAQASDISLTNSQYDLTQNAIGQNVGDITESGNTQIGTYTAPIDNFIYIHDAVNGNIVATITNITTESSIDNIFTALSAHGITGTINNGVISLDGNNEVYASGDILDALGVGANTITTQTATSSTTLKQIGFTNFTNEITRMTKEQAEAEGYEWVTTREQLTAALNGSDTKVMLGCDIDLAGQDWTPIADVFVGELNGNGYVIKNMTITSESANNSDEVGLFCELGDSAYIQNLGFENVNISGSSIQYAGALAARNSGQITIDNCYISNANIESYSDAGGFIADNSGTLNIKNSTIHNSNINGASIAGGLVGTNTGGKLYISDVGIYNTDAYGSDPDGCWGKLVGLNNSVVSASNITTKADSNEYIGYSQDESLVNIYNTGSAQNPNRYIYVHDSFGVIIATIDSISTESSIEDIFNALEPYGISGTMVSGSINLNGNGYVSGNLISELGIETTAPTISGITQTGNPIITPEGSITTSKLTARSYRTVVTSTSISKPYEVTRDTLLGSIVGATGELEIRRQGSGGTITIDTTATVGELINAINEQAGRTIASLEDGRIMIDNNNNGNDAYVTGTLATALGFVNVTSSNEVVSGIVDSATGSVIPDATTVGSDTTMILTLGSGVLESREREYLHAGMTFDELGLTTTNKITVETKEGNQLTITVNITDTVGSFISKLDAIDGIKASITDGGYVVIEQLGKAHIATANQAEYQEIFNLLGISHSALATERLITVSENTTFTELGITEDAELSLTVDGVKIDTGLNANTATLYDYMQLITANSDTNITIHEGILTIDYGDEQIGLDARVLNAINDRSAITSFSSMGLAESGTIEGIQGNKRFTIGVVGTDTLYSLNEKLSEFDMEVTIDSLGQFVFGPKAGASNTAITSISDELSEFFQVNAGANVTYNKFGEATNTDSNTLYLTPFTKNTSSGIVYTEDPYTKNTASANQILISEEEIHDVTRDTTLSDLGFNTSLTLTVTVMETDTTPFGYASNIPESVTIDGNTSINDLVYILNGMGMTASFDEATGKISIQEDLTTFWGLENNLAGNALADLFNVLKVDDADTSTIGTNPEVFNTIVVNKTLYINDTSDQQTISITCTAGASTSLSAVEIGSDLNITIWNGTTTTVVATGDEAFEGWFERLEDENIIASINETTGKVTFTPKSGTGAYIIGMDEGLKNKLGITGDFYETSTTDNTRSLSASDTFGDVLLKNGATYDANKATITYMLNDQEKTFTFSENETFEAAGLRLAQETSGGLTLSVDNTNGKVTITGSNNAYVKGFGDDVASYLKLSAGSGTTWETQTLNGGSNTVSGPTLTIGGGGISPDTKLGDIGFSGTGTITVFNGTSPQEIVVTGDTKLSELSTSGITATVSDNKVTLTPDGNGYIQSISNNLAGVLKISSGNGNTYTTESKTLYKNSESDVIQIADPDATAGDEVKLNQLENFDLGNGKIRVYNATTGANEDITITSGNLSIQEFVSQVNAQTDAVSLSYNEATGILTVSGVGGSTINEIAGGVQFKDAFNLGEPTFETEEITTTTAGSNSITTPPNADANGCLSGVVSGNATGGTKLAELGLNSEGTVGKIVYFDGNKSQEIDATKNTTIEGLSRAGLTVSVDNNGIVTIDLGANCYIESITTDLANALGISGPYYTTEVKTTSGNTASKVLQVGNPGVTAGDNIKLNQLENFDLGNGKIQVYNATTGANEDITITSGNLSIQEFVSQVNAQTDAVSLSYNEATGILTVSGVGGSTINEIAGGVQFKDAFNLGEPTFETETVTRNSVSNNLSETSTVKASNTNMLTALETATGAKLEFIDDTVTLELSTTSTTGASFTTNLVFTTADSLETVAETLLDYGITMTVSNTTGEVKFSAGSLSDFDFNGALGEYLKGDNYTESNSQVIITNKSVSLDAATPRIMGEADSISELGTTLEEGTIQVIQNGQATNVEFTTAGISTTDDVLDFFRGLGFEAEIVAGKVKLNSNDGKSLASVDGGSNVLKVFGLENWSISGFQQTSDTILKDDVTTTKVTSSMINSDDSVKLSDLTNSSGTLLGDMSGTIYINDNGAQTKEITIDDNTTVKDLINELGNDFNVAVNNGKLSITSTGNKKLESGTSSLLTNLGIDDWTYTQTSTSKTLDYVDSNSDTVNIDEKAKLKEIDTDYKAGYISVVKADGNVDNIKLSEEESIESLLKRLEAYDITGYVDPDGQVVLNSSGAYLTAYTTNTEEASNALEILGIGQDKWHLSNNYESKAPVMDIDTEGKTLAADRETELKDLITDFKGGEYYIYNNGVRYTAVLSDDAKLGDFIDQLETFNIQVGLTGTETEASKLTLLGTGNTYIATSQNTSNASNITELFAEGKTEMMTYGGAIDKEVIEVTTTGITEDFKLKDLDPALDVTGKFTITVNGSACEIDITENDTIGTFISKLDKVGVKASLSEDGTAFRIESGFNTISIDTTAEGTTKNLAEALGLGAEQKAFGGYSVSDKTVYQTIEYTERISPANFASEGTALETLGISAGSFTVYRDGQKATVTIENGETFGSLEEKIQNEFGTDDVVLTFTPNKPNGLDAEGNPITTLDGVLRIYSTTEGVEIKTGSVSDTSNFSAIVGLRADENSNGVRSSREMYCVNGNTKLTTENLFRTGNITEGFFVIGDAEFEITEETTLNNLIAQINSNDKAGATAYWDNIKGQFVIKSKDSGASLLNIESGSLDGNKTASNFTDILGFTVTENGVSKIVTQSQDVGQNANFSIDGTKFTSTSNTIDSSISRIEGLTIELKEVTPEGETVTIKVEKDDDTLANVIEEVIASYNQLMSNIDKQIAMGGALHDETTLKYMRDRIWRLMTSSEKATSVFRNLDSIGISTAKGDGANVSTGDAVVQLEFDKEKFSEVYRKNPNDIKELLLGSDKDGDGEIKGIEAGVFTELENLITEAFNTGGYFTSATNSFNNKISTLNTRISKANQQVERYRMRLEKKFSAMDLLIGNIQNQYSSFLGTSFGGLG